MKFPTSEILSMLTAHGGAHEILIAGIAAGMADRRLRASEHANFVLEINAKAGADRKSLKQRLETVDTIATNSENTLRTVGQ